MPPEPSRLDDLRIDDAARQEPVARRGRLAGVVAVLVLLLLAVGLGWWWRAAAAPVVRTAVAREATLTRAGAGTVLEASGYVTARREATVSSKITGKVVEVLVEEGMAVEEGQVLARLDDSLVVRELALAEARLTQARSAVAEIEVRLAEAERNLGRTERLAAGEVASQFQLDADRAEVDSLQARLANARDQVEVAGREVVLQRQRLDDTLIRAPFDGVAISKDAQPGEMISPVSAGGGFTRTGISTIVDMGSLEIEVDVNESYINRVAPGQGVVATLDAYPEWSIPASVITTVPAADRQKATVKVRIGFERLDPRILPDMGVKVAFLEAAGEETGAEEASPRILVPRAAVRQEGARDLVWVVDGETLERRAVTRGAARGEELEVRSGLVAGERVVVAGPEGLAPGVRVKIDEGVER